MEEDTCLVEEARTKEKDNEHVQLKVFVNLGSRWKLQDKDNCS